MADFSFRELLAQADSSGFGTIPPNEYDTRIDSAEVRTTGTGKQKITVKYKILGGPLSGRIIFDDMVLSPGSPNAMAIFFRTMGALGLDAGYFSAEPSLAKVAEDLKGREQRLKTDMRTWQGVERTNVAAILPARANRGFEAPGGNGNGSSTHPPFDNGGYLPPAQGQYVIQPQDIPAAPVSDDPPWLAQIAEPAPPVSEPEPPVFEAEVFSEPVEDTFTEPEKQDDGSLPPPPPGLPF